MSILIIIKLIWKGFKWLYLIFKSKYLLAKCKQYNYTGV